MARVEGDPHDSVGEDVEHFGRPHSLVISALIFLGLIVAMFVIVPGPSDGWEATGFFIILVAAAIYLPFFTLFTQYGATLGPGNVVTFHAILRHRVTHVEDVRRITRRHGENGGWIFEFTGGSSTLTGRAGARLAARLRELNPVIEMRETFPPGELPAP